MLGRDPIRRGLNPYPYCDNDPVNYTDPTGEIANILGGALTGGVVGGVFGFAGSAVSQLMSGKGIDMRRALGAGVNGAVVGAVRGAMIASGAGAFAGAGADFAAGMIGNALEQYIAGDNVDFGRTVTSGLSNAASGLAYGTGRIGSIGEAFRRGFGSGAARSGIEYLYETLGKSKKKNRRKSRNLRRRTRRTIAPQLYGISDPRRNCTVQRSSTQKQLPGNGIVNKGLYEAMEDKLRTTEGFNLLGFAKAVALGGVMEGLGSAAFYGVGKGLESLWRSVKGSKGSNYAYPDKTDSLLYKRAELTGSPRNKLLATIQDSELNKIANELYRPKAMVGDGGTAAILVEEYNNGSTMHLIKATERLKQLRNLEKSGKLGLNDRDVAEALISDLEYKSQRSETGTK